MKVTAGDLHKLGMIDAVIEEPMGGAHRFPMETAENVRRALTKTFSELSQMSIEDLIAKRHERYQQMGEWTRAKD